MESPEKLTVVEGSLLVEDSRFVHQLDDGGFREYPFGGLSEGRVSEVRIDAGGSAGALAFASGLCSLALWLCFKTGLLWKIGAGISGFLGMVVFIFALTARKRTVEFKFEGGVFSFTTTDLGSQVKAVLEKVWKYNDSQNGGDDKRRDGSRRSANDGLSNWENWLV